MEEQAVLVTIKLSEPAFGKEEERKRLLSFETMLQEAAMRIGGEYDGHEFGNGECVFYLYGPSADSLYSSILPVLAKVRPQSGSYVIKRYGPVGSPKKRESCDYTSRS